MGALDPEKILMILVIALIVLGPERLPKVARQLGGWWRELMNIRARFEAEVRSALPDDLPKMPKIPTSGRSAVAGLLSGLTAPLASADDNGSGGAVDGADGADDDVEGEVIDAWLGEDDSGPQSDGNGSGFGLEPAPVAASDAVNLRYSAPPPDDPSMN